MGLCPPTLQRFVFSANTLTSSARKPYRSTSDDVAITPRHFIEKLMFILGKNGGDGPNGANRNDIGDSENTAAASGKKRSSNVGNGNDKPTGSTNDLLPAEESRLLLEQVGVTVGGHERNNNNNGSGSGGRAMTNPVTTTVSGKSGATNAAPATADTAGVFVATAGVSGHVGEVSVSPASAAQRDGPTAGVSRGGSTGSGAEGPWLRRRSRAPSSFRYCKELRNRAEEVVTQALKLYSTKGLKKAVQYLIGTNFISDTPR